MALTGPDDIKGVWATILCRLDEHGCPDLSAINEQVAAFAAAGCDGAYSGGTASEIHSQTEAQFRSISTEFAKAARAHGLPFQVGAAHPLAHGTLERVAFATSLKPGAIQITLPDWIPLDLASVQQFFSQVAETADGCPLVLYNPPHSKTVLTPSELITVAQDTPTLVGLKCGGGDAEWYRQISPLLDRLSVFIPGHHYASGKSQGAHGSYSNIACLSPAGAVHWARISNAEAIALEARVAAFMGDAIQPLLDRGLPGFACDKALAAAGGWVRIRPALMWPYTGATGDDVARIARLAGKHIPEFLEEIDA